MLRSTREGATPHVARSARRDYLQILLEFGPRPPDTPRDVVGLDFFKIPPKLIKCFP